LATKYIQQTTTKVEFICFSLDFQKMYFQKRRFSKTKDTITMLLANSFSVIFNLSCRQP